MATKYKQSTNVKNIKAEETLITFQETKISKLKFQELKHGKVLRRVSKTKNISHKNIKISRVSQVTKWKIKFKEVKALDRNMKHIQNKLKDNDKAQLESLVSQQLSSNPSPIVNISKIDSKVITISDDELELTNTEQKNFLNSMNTVDNFQDSKVKYKPCPNSKQRNISVKPYIKNEKPSESINVCATLNNNNNPSTSNEQKPETIAKTLDEVKKVKRTRGSKSRGLNETESKIHTSNIISDKDTSFVIKPKLINSPNATQKYNTRCRAKMQYPPPYPEIPPHKSQPSWKKIPSAPSMKINTNGNDVTLTWDIKSDLTKADVKMFELYVCRETDEIPDSSMWTKIGEIKTDLYPMVYKIKALGKGNTYYFALRAVDIYDRRAPFTIKNISI